MSPPLLAGAYLVYVSLDWLVEWLAEQKDTPFGSQSLGWLSGWLMVLPNALLAFFYAARRRADIVYASQIGDGHICIPSASVSPPRPTAPRCRRSSRPALACLSAPSSSTPPPSSAPTACRVDGSGRSSRLMRGSSVTGFVG